jgi:CRP-like cAMP-binding protein
MAGLFHYDGICGEMLRNYEGITSNLTFGENINSVFEVVLKKINEKVTLDATESEAIKAFFIPKKIRKRQYLLNEGDVSQHTAFVERGLLRSYTVDDKANEHIIQFALEGWWIADMYSFLTSEPASYNIDAIEDSELLLLTPRSMDEMLLKIPKMERYFRILQQNSLIALQRRVIGSLSLTAEEKYLKLIDNYPDIVQRAPQQYIASYLGITPETLSRIRKQMTRK